MYEFASQHWYLFKHEWLTVKLVIPPTLTRFIDAVELKSKYKALAAFAELWRVKEFARLDLLCGGVQLMWRNHSQLQVSRQRW